VRVRGEVVDAALNLIRHFRHEIERRIDDYAANPHLEPVPMAAE
jgi:hypothetical protein